MMPAELSKIEKLLASRIGLDPVSVGSQLILRAARQRMKELGLVDIGAYEGWLRQSELELQALIEEVVVSESWFFRDERPFQWFREHIRMHWLGDVLRPPLRVLSLPCAGGEEPYSIAMTLRDLKLPVRRFHIDAVDISAHRLAIARRGVYSSNAFRGSDLSFQARYFREHPQGYELDSSIRSMVCFLQASVLDPHLLEGSPPYDVVFCRNLLIYLGVSARECVLTAIMRLLAPDGLFFIGHADRLEIRGVEPKFTPVGDPACFVYRRRVGGDSSLPRQELAPHWPFSSLVESSGPSLGPVTVPPIYASPVITNSRIDQMGEATIPSSQPDEVPLLDQAAELANRGRFDDAIAACEHHLRLKNISPPAYYLMGMICQAAGDRRRAEDCFHKTVYLDPMHDEALLALALLAERRGDHDAATGFRRRAERSMTMSRKRVN
jgi:chemotaxis protein methyltransferase WspC